MRSPSGDEVLGPRTDLPAAIIGRRSADLLSSGCLSRTLLFRWVVALGWPGAWSRPDAVALPACRRGLHRIVLRPRRVRCMTHEGPSWPLAAACTGVARFGTVASLRKRAGVRGASHSGLALSLKLCPEGHEEVGQCHVSRLSADRRP